MLLRLSLSLSPQVVGEEDALLCPAPGLYSRSKDRVVEEPLYCSFSNNLHLQLGPWYRLSSGTKPQVKLF